MGGGRWGVSGEWWDPLVGKNAYAFNAGFGGYLLTPYKCQSKPKKPPHLKSCVPPLFLAFFLSIKSKGDGGVIVAQIRIHSCTFTMTLYHTT